MEGSVRSAGWPGAIVSTAVRAASAGPAITGFFGGFGRIIFNVGRWLSTGQAVPAVFSGGVIFGTGR